MEIIPALIIILVCALEGALTRRDKAAERIAPHMLQDDEPIL